MNTTPIIVDRTTTWHAIGKSVEECKNMEEVLRLSGLDYEVEKRPVYMGKSWEDDAGTIEIPNRYVTVRTRDNHPYDVISDQFEIIQNREAFDFVDYMGDEISYEKAGETKNGMVYIIGKLPEVDILGDAFTPHVIFRNGFTGKVKITAAICPLRMVCQNQFNFAFKNTDNTVTIRHVHNAPQKLEEAREILRVAADYMQEINRMAQTYAVKKLSPKALEWALNMMFPMPKEGEKINSFAKNRMETARAEFTRAYTADDNANFRGTAWGMINAYTDFLTHKDIVHPTADKQEGRFIKTTFGQPMNQILTLVERIAA